MGYTAWGHVVCTRGKKSLAVEVEMGRAGVNLSSNIFGVACDISRAETDPKREVE